MMLDAWHSFTDSDSFRWFVKRGPARTLFRSRAYKRANVARNRIRTRTAAYRQPDVFRNVGTFCFFVGHNKSGSSMLSGLLDAHPNVVLSDEVDVLQYVEAGCTREQIFHLIHKGAAAEARKGRITARRLEPYSYSVPGQWQGTAEAPVVVGDSTTGTSTRRLGRRPQLLAETASTMNDVGVKLVHVIRNPFDPISVMMVRGGRSFQNSIDHYFTSCAVLADIQHLAGAGGLLPVRYEDFVVDPTARLAEVCGFLGVDADSEYLRACAQIIKPAPERSRHMVEWTSRWIDVVHQRLSTFDFLKGYSYEN